MSNGELTQTREEIQTRKEGRGGRTYDPEDKKPDPVVEAVEEVAWVNPYLKDSENEAHGGEEVNTQGN